MAYVDDISGISDIIPENMDMSNATVALFPSLIRQGGILKRLPTTKLAGGHEGRE